MRPVLPQRPRPVPPASPRALRSGLQTGGNSGRPGTGRQGKAAAESRRTGRPRAPSASAPSGGRSGLRLGGPCGRAGGLGEPRGRASARASPIALPAAGEQPHQRGCRPGSAPGHARAARCAFNGGGCAAAGGLRGGDGAARHGTARRRLPVASLGAAGGWAVRDLRREQMERQGAGCRRAGRAPRASS